jgi:hypothetical protein
MPIIAINAGGNDDLDPTIPDSDQAIYIIVDTTNKLYHTRIRPFAEDLDKFGGFFIPRLNKDGTRALIQIKVNKDAYPWINVISPGIIGKGDKYWAADQIFAMSEEWEGAYNNWQIHREFLTGLINEILYETRLEEGRTALATVIIKSL